MLPLRKNILTQNSKGNGIVRMNGTRNISSTVDERNQWHGVGMSGAMLQFGNSVQTNWKLASTLLMSGRVDKR